MARIVAQVTAGIILVLSVASIMMGSAWGMTELTPEAYAFLGVITGSSAMFLFSASTKHNGTMITKDTG